MADQDQDQKTEQATEKRLSEAMSRGQFAKAQEITVLFPIAAVLGVLTLTTASVARDVAEYSAGIFSRLGTTTVAHDTVMLRLGELMTLIGQALAPVLLAVIVAVIIANGLQSGFRLAPEALEMNPGKLNPVDGFGRLFNKSVLVRTGIDLLKLFGIGGALWLGARGLMYDPLFSAPVEAAYLGQFLNHSTFLFMTRLLLALSVVAAISYSYEKFKMARDLMMTRDEVKEERKQQEGDMLAKGAMRRMARRLLQKQMLSAVATADVVVTNPTHNAVALKYERGVDQAPVVLAKGENRFAQRIKALAAEHGVPTVENKPVARMLFAMGRVGETIPAELYQAVAGILAVVYRTHRYYFHRLKVRRMEAAA
jgi:flagellar biosynthetic protein FlhB